MLSRTLSGPLRSRGTPIDYTRVDELVEELKTGFNVTLEDPDLGCKVEGFRRKYAVRKPLGGPTSGWYLGGVFLSDYTEAVFVPYYSAESVARNRPDVMKVLADVKSIVAKYPSVRRS